MLSKKQVDKLATKLATMKRVKNPQTLEEKIEYAQVHDYDCIVQCQKCGRTEFLEFKNGLKHGWSTCCGGLTMPIIWQEADIEKAVSDVVNEAKKASIII